jgi:protein-S-isoprenylcysteine O-methyltransferase Ste14
LSAEPKPVPTLWQRATYRWTAITAVMAVLLVLYTQHPYYKGGQFAPWRSYYPIAFVVWLALGLPYVKATLEKFAGMRYAMRDGGLHLLILGRSLLNADGDPAELARRAQRAMRRGVIAGGMLSLAGVVLRAGGIDIHTERALGLALGVTRPAPAYVVGLAAQLGLGLLAGLFFHWLADHAGRGRFWKMAKKPRLRNTCLGIFVKGFFTPLMIGFLSGHANNIVEAWLRHKHLPPFKMAPVQGNVVVQLSAWFGHLRERMGDLVPSGADLSGLVHFGAWTRADVSWGLGLAYDLVFFIDCGTALIGYSLESRWLGNKTRSVEPTFLGWAAALSCYPPYNNVLGTYLPLENGPSIITGENTLLAFRAVTVLLFAIYASATVAFGFKFSNLTNRGVISRGPYRFIRHPAYVCKCTAWWLEHLPTLTLTKAFFLTLLCCVYALRAWTEERHLSMDPEYRAYKRKVPWVILPGVY